METIELEEMNLSERHLNAIDYAFKCIKDSELFPYIEKLFFMVVAHMGQLNGIVMLICALFYLKILE